jgi:transposase
MMIIGCDFHPRFQQIAFLDQATGECGERRLNHPLEAADFYRSLARGQVLIGLEATGNFRWFRRLMDELGQQVWLGDASAIRASVVRRQKTDKLDARHILKLLLEERFPRVWQAPADNDALRQLVLHRCRMVRLRAQVKNQLDAVAKNEGEVDKRAWSGLRRRQIEALPLTGWYNRRRQDLLALMDTLDGQIDPLDKAVEQAAWADEAARRLMTHPGVGPVVSLTYVLTIGDWQRFQRGKNVASYLGLIPEEGSSGDSRRLGHITKQGNTLLRWLLVEAATKAQKHDPSWHRQYLRLSMNKHHGVAKVAIAHKLAVRLYWMWRSGQDWQQIMERGSHAGQSA